jgi:hypothetical protein
MVVSGLLRCPLAQLTRVKLKWSYEWLLPRRAIAGDRRTFLHITPSAVMLLKSGYNQQGR